MLFNSLHFLIFFPVVTTAYFLLPHRVRWLLLVAASIYFYMAAIPIYILILFALILIDYAAGRMIEPAVGRRRRFYLVASIVANVGVLGVFKYFNFVNTNLSFLATSLTGWKWPLHHFDVILPIGLSFHTFQSMSYTIEVYRGAQKAERNLGIYALYVLFYPQLVAGPIERPQHLLHQFYERHRFEFDRMASGLTLMLWGFFKKTVIADRLAPSVAYVYSNPRDFHGPELLIATVFFAYQIYCDFSGYSDIAIGVAQVMGFELVTNFDRPYQSASIGEFWRRWHMSLSSWFRDYVYIPLGGNRATPLRTDFNLLVTFVLSGLWHGANWTFVVWGGINGLYLVLSKRTQKIRDRLVTFAGLDKYPRIHRMIRVLLTFSLTCLAWVFFRAANLTEAIHILIGIFTGTAAFLKSILTGHMVSAHLGMSVIDLSVVLACILFMECIQSHRNGRDVRILVQQAPAYTRWAFGILILWSVLLLGVFQSRQFIYFQF
jgi:alginate O-acetyltransferase complex protein AlgI